MGVTAPEIQRCGTDRAVHEDRSARVLGTAIEEWAKDNAKLLSQTSGASGRSGRSPGHTILLSAAIGAGAGLLFAIPAAKAADAEDRPKMIIGVTGVFALIGAAVGYKLVQ